MEGERGGVVRDMVSYAVSVLRRVVSDGFTGDAGYDGVDDAAAAASGGEVGDAGAQVEVWDGAIDAEARAVWERVKDALQDGLVSRSAYNTWFKGSVGLWLRGDEIGVGFPAAYQAVQFALRYAGSSPIRTSTERGAGRELDCNPYALFNNQGED